MYYIGIDLGTSAVKLLLTDENGVVRNTVSRAYPLSFPKPGWSEQDPNDWYRETMTGLGALLKGFEKRQVVAMAVAGQMHGLVALDKDDQVLRPAILWNDGRAIRETSDLNEKVGREVLAARTGNIAFAGFTAPKLLWMRQNEPHLFERIHKILLPKDYLNFRLTGVYATDPSDASGTLYYDVARRRWSPEMLQLLGITEAQLPKVFESFAPIGTLQKDVARTLGLPSDVVVAGGAADNAAAALGTGTVGDGACMISLGTSGTVFLSSDTFRKDDSFALHAFAHANGTFNLLGCMLSAASCNQWWMERILRTTSFEQEQSELDADDLGKNDVYFLPYLMGERSPYNDPMARGAFIGLRADTDRAQMTQAVLEGVAFGIADMVAAAKQLGATLSECRVCGGGAKSALWRKILANVLNVRVTTISNQEGPGLGAAILAMAAYDAHRDVNTLSKRVAVAGETVSPEPELAARYEARHQQYRKLYPALAPFYHQA